MARLFLQYLSIYIHENGHTGHEQALEKFSDPKVTNSIFKNNTRKM